MGQMGRMDRWADGPMGLMGLMGRWGRWGRWADGQMGQMDRWGRWGRWADVGRERVRRERMEGGRVIARSEARATHLFSARRDQRARMWQMGEKKGFRPHSSLFYRN